MQLPGPDLWLQNNTHNPIKQWGYSSLIWALNSSRDHHGNTLSVATYWMQGLWRKQEQAFPAVCPDWLVFLCIIVALHTPNPTLYLLCGLSLLPVALQPCSRNTSKEHVQWGWATATWKRVPGEVHVRTSQLLYRDTTTNESANESRNKNKPTWTETGPMFPHKP